MKGYLGVLVLEIDVSGVENVGSKLHRSDSRAKRHVPGAVTDESTVPEMCFPARTLLLDIFLNPKS